MGLKLFLNMIYNSSSCLRASTLTARITPRSVTPIWSPKSCVAQPILKQQARCLSTSPIFTKNGQTSTFRPFYKHADKAPGLSKVFSIRFASTSASPIVPANDPSPSLPESPYQPLTWEAYLSLRQKRRYYNVIASSLTALGTFAGGASFLLAQDIEKISGFMFGLDPFIAMGLVCFGFGAMGWLLGPFAGGSLFRLVHRRVNRSMQAVRQHLLIPFPPPQAQALTCLIFLHVEREGFLSPH